jgi:RhtB (resistance to homoserine/threonine) family protein
VNLIPFLAVSAVVIIAPGPDMALVGRNALFAGRRAGVYTTIGVVLGLAVWSLAASVGVAALLRRSEPAFVALKVVGAVYLVWLGLQALRVAWRGNDRDTTAALALSSRPGPRRALRQGFLSNLANPKIAVFFTSFLPQFASSNASFAALLALGLVFCLMTLVWLAGYGVFVAKAGDVLRRPGIRRVMEGVTGTVLIGFGVRLATADR